jgi:hypothetical protein
VSTSKKIPAADRSHGGPGSSQQDRTEDKPREPRGPAPGEPTSSRRSHVSGGGGERDIHHSHDPATKS